MLTFYSSYHISRIDLKDRILVPRFQILALHRTTEESNKFSCL